MPVRLIAYQSCKHCDGVDQRKTRFNRRKKAVVEDDQWTIARFMRPGERCRYWVAPQMEKNGLTRSLKVLYTQWNSFHVENGLLKRAWKRADRRHLTHYAVGGSVHQNQRRTTRNA